MASHFSFMAVLILFSLIFSVFHLPQGAPDWLGYWRPQWILLALILWVQCIPAYRGGLFELLFTKSASDDGTTARRVLVVVWLLGFTSILCWGTRWVLMARLAQRLPFICCAFESVYKCKPYCSR